MTLPELRAVNQNLRLVSQAKIIGGIRNSLSKIHEEQRNGSRSQKALPHSIAMPMLGGHQTLHVRGWIRGSGWDINQLELQTGDSWFLPP